MITLKRSIDRKTANLATPNGKQAKIKNAFGLLAGSDYSCTGMTTVCQKVCYAGKLEKLFPGFRNVMAENWNAVKDASYDELFIALSNMISEFEADCDKWGAEKKFRIHHDGDMFSVTYSRAWADVVKAHPLTQFWVYTRSFTDKLNIIPEIAGIDNLSVYISVDKDNEQFAGAILRTYPTVRVAYLAETFDSAATGVREARAGHPSGSPIGAACPELAGKIPLINVNGGACFSCGLCLDSKADIRFAISGK